MSTLEPPHRGDDWFGLTDQSLPAGRALDWVVLPRCGAVVLFTGTVRDHAEGRTDVVRLEYEAYEEQVEPALRAIAGEARARWAELGRIVLLHRIGEVATGEASVIVAVSAPHRSEAFDAARFAIDTLKASVPIWKQEFWGDGSGWGLGAQDIRAVGSVVEPEPADSRG